MLNYAEPASSSTIVPVESIPCHQSQDSASASPSPSSYTMGPLDPAQITILPVHLSSGETCSLLIPVQLAPSFLTDSEFTEGYEAGYLDGEAEAEWSVPQIVNWTYNTIKNELWHEDAWEELGMHLPAWIVGWVLGDLAWLAKTERTLAQVGLAHLCFLLPFLTLDSPFWPPCRFYGADYPHMAALRAYRAQVRVYREQGKIFEEAQRLALAASAPPQADPDWSIGKEFGDWLYQGKPGEIRIPGFLNQVIDAAFAQGFWRGRALLLEREDGNWCILTDQEFSALIAQELPATLPEGAIAPWKQGFIFGWCMTWHSQPFLIEEAEAHDEDQSEAASCEAMY